MLARRGSGVRWRQMTRYAIRKSQAAIMQTMRRRLSFLWIVLLVLRGLLGDAMAMAGPATATLAGHAACMPAHQHHADPQAAAQASHDRVADCAQAAAPLAAQAMGHGLCGPGASPGDCDPTADGSCTYCSMCHTPLYTLSIAATGMDSARPSLRGQDTARFLSACLALTTKPPIALA